jgi:archaellum component FlaC
MVEEFTSQVKLLAESVSGIQEQLVALREMVAKNTEDIKTLKEDVRGLKEMVAQNTKDIRALKEMVAKNTEDIAIIKLDIEAIKQNLRMKVDLADFQALEKRVSQLEAKIK